MRRGGTITVQHFRSNISELSEPDAYRRDVPKAEVHLLDAGHFALDTAADQLRSSSGAS